MVTRIWELRKMCREELISEVRKRDLEIIKLKKEKEKLSVKWRNYYYGKDYRERRKNKMKGGKK